MYEDWAQIMTEKFTKNISYMTYPFSPATSFIAINLKNWTSV